MKNPHGHDWSHAVWQIKMNRNTKDTTKTQRHANPPARFAFRHSENSKANSKRGKSPTKTPTQEDLPQDTVVHTTVSIKRALKQISCHSSNARHSILNAAKDEQSFIALAVHYQEKQPLRVLSHVLVHVASSRIGSKCRNA